MSELHVKALEEFIINTEHVTSVSLYTSGSQYFFQLFPLRLSDQIPNTTHYHPGHFFLLSAGADVPRGLLLTHALFPRSSQQASPVH